MRHAPNRRDFLKTAGAATLAALAADGGRPLRAADNDLLKPTADTVILLWMAGGMPHTETFDPKRYTPFRKGLKAGDVACTFPTIDTAVDGIKFTEGLEKIGSVMDRGTLIRSHVLGDLGFDPALAASVSLAHRLRAAADRRRAAHRRVDRPRPRAARPGRAGLHRHRPALRGQRRGRGAEGLPDRRLPRQRIRPVPRPRPEQAIATVRAPAGMSAGALPQHREAYHKKLVEASPVVRARQRLPAANRCSARWRTPTACSTPPRRRRSTCRWSRRRPTTPTTPAASASAACSPDG